MRIAATIILVLSIALASFGYWGLNTKAGRTRFDEMAGMIPFFALIAAGVLLLVGGAMLIYTFMGSTTQD